MRAAIYARYSSDNQRAASIEDQVRICRAQIERLGAELIATYTDHAISGSTRLRPGYQKLLEDALKGAKIKHGMVAQKLAKHIWPGELVSILQRRDAAARTRFGELGREFLELGDTNSGLHVGHFEVVTKM